jgi:hypothetical protein
LSKAVHGLHHAAHIRLLIRQHPLVPEGVELYSQAVLVEIGVHPVDVVVPMEGVPLPRAAVLGAPVVEEHDAHVDAPLLGRSDPLLHSLEISRVQALEVKLGQAVARVAGASSPPGVRGDTCPGAGIPGVLHDPEAEEVVGVACEAVQVGLIAAYLGDGLHPTLPGNVLQIGPGVGAGQVNDVAGAVLEVARVACGDAQRTSGRGQLGSAGFRHHRRFV